MQGSSVPSWNRFRRCVSASDEAGRPRPGQWRRRHATTRDIRTRHDPQPHLQPCARLRRSGGGHGGEHRQSAGRKQGQQERNDGGGAEVRALREGHDVTCTGRSGNNMPGRDLQASCQFAFSGGGKVERTGRPPFPASAILTGRCEEKPNALPKNRVNCRKVRLSAPPRPRRCRSRGTGPAPRRGPPPARWSARQASGAPSSCGGSPSARRCRG